MDPSRLHSAIPAHSGLETFACCSTRLFAYFMEHHRRTSHDFWSEEGHLGEGRT